MRYHVYLEAEPTLEAYRLSHQTRSGYAPLEQAGSTDWPLHTCGTVGSSSAAGQRAIARSWNYTDFVPLNWAAVADDQAAHHALFGRYPSFARLMKNARIKDQILVFD